MNENREQKAVGKVIDLMAELKRALADHTTCTHCAGAGWEPDTALTDLTRCSECGGSGWVPIVINTGAHDG
jgi:DnaJ-class molecular chaperone